MVPTVSGRSSLILVVTRRCDLRCAYCPTAKDGEPDLSVDDALRAVEIFVDQFGGGDCKIFGGEPLLIPDVVDAVLRAAPPSISIYLSTNGTHLAPRWIALLREYPQVTLTLSVDGQARDHDGLRRGSAGTAASHARVLALLPELLTLPRFVVTQTIAPSTAVRAADNFRYLYSLGIRRFNLLPGYYLPWSGAQLAALEDSFCEIGTIFADAWARGERLYLRNLFTRAPTPFYNTGLVVDSDRRIYPSNLILAGALDHLRDELAVGDLDKPPSRAELEDAARAVPDVLASQMSPGIMDATAAADATLTRLCNRLYPHYFERRAREVAA